MPQITFTITGEDRIAIGEVFIIQDKSIPATVARIANIVMETRWIKVLIEVYTEEDGYMPAFVIENPKHSKGRLN